MMDNRENIDISIILLNYKNKQLTRNCIQSIIASEPNLSYEIIVIDNHSQDDSVDFLRTQFSQITVIDSGKNGGFSFGNNAGVRISRGRNLLLLNNDTEIKKGMLDALLEFSEKNPDTGMIGCKALDPKGDELPVAHQYESIRRIILQIYIKPILEKIGVQRYLVRLFSERSKASFFIAEWISGSAMFISRKLYYQIGGLDEQFFMYMEDEDLCHRVKDAGYNNGIIDYIGYVHYCGGSTIPSYFLTKEYIKSRLIYFMRYYPQRITLIKKLLYRQIKAYNESITRSERKKMKKELDDFVSNELADAAAEIKGIQK